MTLFTKKQLETIQILCSILSDLYPHETEDHLERRLLLYLNRYGSSFHKIDPDMEYWDEKDAVLITYGDSIKSQEENPLSVLNTFLKESQDFAFSTVHILPFFPYSSDDGFSVIDFYKVDPDLGTWKDIKELNKRYSLMFDLVLNHASSQGKWFKDYQKGIAPQRHYFVEMDWDDRLNEVTRPRATPLLTEYETRNGKKKVWTTFSADQIDLNFAHPDVLFEMVDVLLHYIHYGARIIRLDAIAYLWKELGTTCIHHENTHKVVKFFRGFLDLVAPSTVLLTETNVPHEENLSYFGDGDEANMIYQFSLPPLLLFSLLNEDATILTQWASSLPEVRSNQTFLNFTASHDGIGVRPLQGLVSEDEFNSLIEHVQTMGGKISYKQNSDGSKSPYELNITYFSALGKPDDELKEAHIQRFVMSQAVSMVLKGIPAIYINSLFGIGNDYQGFMETGRARTLNRKKWHLNHVHQLLEDTSLHNGKVYNRIRHLLNYKKKYDVFHPNAKQEVIDINSSLFIIRRCNNSEEITCIFNFTKIFQRVELPYENGVDILTGNEYSKSTIDLYPYQFIWLLKKA